MFRKACLPDIRYKDTKNGKSLDRIYKKVSIKCRNKKTSKLFRTPRLVLITYFNLKLLPMN